MLLCIYSLMGKRQRYMCFCIYQASLQLLLPGLRVSLLSSSFLFCPEVLTRATGGQGLYYFNEIISPCRDFRRYVVSIR